MKKISSEKAVPAIFAIAGGIVGIFLNSIGAAIVGALVGWALGRLISRDMKKQDSNNLNT